MARSILVFAFALWPALLQASPLPEFYGLYAVTEGGQLVQIDAEEPILLANLSHFIVFDKSIASLTQDANSSVRVEQMRTLRYVIELRSDPRTHELVHREAHELDLPELHQEIRVNVGPVPDQPEMIKFAPTKSLTAGMYAVKYSSLFGAVGIGSTFEDALAGSPCRDLHVITTNTDEFTGWDSWNKMIQPGNFRLSNDLRVATGQMSQKLAGVMKMLKYPPLEQSREDCALWDGGGFPDSELLSGGVRLEPHSTPSADAAADYGSAPSAKPPNSRALPMDWSWTEAADPSEAIIRAWQGLDPLVAFPISEGEEKTWERIQVDQNEVVTRYREDTIVGRRQMHNRDYWEFATAQTRSDGVKLEAFETHLRFTPTGWVQGLPTGVEVLAFPWPPRLGQSWPVVVPGSGRELECSVSGVGTLVIGSRSHQDVIEIRCEGEWTVYEPAKGGRTKKPPKVLARFPYLVRNFEAPRSGGVASASWVGPTRWYKHRVDN